MKNLFELAEFYRDQNFTRGSCDMSPQAALHKSAVALTETYTDLAEADSEDLTRYDAWGNEIEPQMVRQAVAYLRAHPQWIQEQLKAVQIRIDQRAGERVDSMPEGEHMDKHVERLEGEAIRAGEILDRASALIRLHFEHSKST